MEDQWVDDSAHANFWRRLLNQRVDELVNSVKWLKSLRYRNDEMKWWQKKCGHIFEERGLNLYELVAQSHGECWEMPDYDEATFKKEWGNPTQDEEKSAPEKIVPEKIAPSELKVEKPRQQDAVSLDHTCEIGLRRKKEEEFELQVRSGDEGCESDVQARRKGRESLYRRAGGSST
jgi:hypothetical protein